MLFGVPSCVTDANDLKDRFDFAARPTRFVASGESLEVLNADRVYEANATVFKVARAMLHKSLASRS